MFGSIVNDWQKIVPMMFVKHYALNFVLPQKIFNKETTEVRQAIFDTAKHSCQLRVDTYDSYKDDFDPLAILEF